MSPVKPVQIAIVDDVLLYRKSIQLYLSQAPHIQVALTTDSGFALLTYLQNHHLDVVLLDLHMPSISGFDVCTQLRQQYPEVKILIVSQLTDDLSVHKVMLTGAHGFFSKNTDPEGLTDAIDRLLSHGYFFSMDLQSVIALAHDLPSFEVALHPMPELSPTEKTVLRYTAQGLANKEIADRLGLSARTIEKHKENILKKYQQNNIIGAFVVALKQQHIQLGEV